MSDDSEFSNAERARAAAIRSWNGTLWPPEPEFLFACSPIEIDFVEVTCESVSIP
jgi:hypothetical protein